VKIIECEQVCDCTSTTPDAFLLDYYSMAYSACFDGNDNLYVADMDRSRVLYYDKPTAFLNQPTISSISPTSGSTSGGTSVTITGTNFVSGATVRFGGTNAAVNSLSSTSILATSPGHVAGTFPVTVTNPDGQSASYTGFTYQCPSIALSPASLPQGVVSTLYSQGITASGGAPPYTFAVTSGALPSGLTLSTGGLLSGTPAAAGSFTFTVTATDAWGCTGSSSYSLTITLVPAARFYSLAPCRVLDTRDPAGPYGAPALSGAAVRTFVIAGRCGVPAGAKAISANLVAVGPTSGGTIIAYPASSPVPLAGMLSYAAGQTIAVQSTIPLDSNGSIGVFPYQAGGTTVNLIVDVSGYFQ